MKIHQLIFTEQNDWKPLRGDRSSSDASLALVFGDRILFETQEFQEGINERFPNASIVFCSTSGEIQDTLVYDSSFSITALELEHTQVKTEVIHISESGNSFEAGQLLASKMLDDELRHVMVFSDGQQVNGTELSRGFNETLPEGVILTGGLAGDGTRFEKTLVGLDQHPSEGNIVAIGFYGERWEVGFGSSGGWIPFGLEHEVTRSDGNILYELDGKPALALYKEFLGDQAHLLPGAALRFPLSITTPTQDRTVVRTILSINEEDQSMVFAGDIPKGSYARFMRASFDELVAGATKAAEESMSKNNLDEAELAICVSCVGRKIVMGQHIEDETEAVREIIGDYPAITGFYSYGELAPPSDSEWCELHNQTMTITLLREV